ncbi:snapalysin family zinc-dependent metalloprotease [Kitasatospora sp. NPDC093102]|uniref:snapalysin family zinc-dependent metalloprotease n=1 Tax=Kitasatospora sp. NPDC093102 TaxID=3155069 RepID=UPI0034354024
MTGVQGHAGGPADGSTGAARGTGRTSRAAQIRNGSERNVQLQETSGTGGFSCCEGGDSRGSCADTDGHGHVFLDYRQNRRNRRN